MAPKQEPLVAAAPAPAAPPRVRRSRHYPRPWNFYLGALLLAVSTMATAAFLVVTVVMLMQGDRALGYAAIGLFSFATVTRVWALFNNHNLHCPLCHGTVLREGRCRKHAEAARIPGLTYRATVVLSALFTGHFRCMYCGTPFRLVK
jgi:hypothetical protein